MFRRKTTAKTAANPIPSAPQEPWDQRLISTMNPLRILWNKLQDLPRTNYELGVEHMQMGNITDAVMRFKFVTRLRPTHAQAWYGLGCCELDLGHVDNARRALEKTLSLIPDNEEARYMLAMAGGRQTPTRMPLTLAQNQFDGFASTFTADQQARGYKGHEILFAALAPQLEQGRADYAMLEYGIGTGLCGPIFKARASRLVGVELSPQMVGLATHLRDAAGRPVYDELITKDILTYLQTAPAEAFDVVVAADMLAYLGDLDAVMAGTAKVLKLGGLFAFTADKTEIGNYALDSVQGRFAYSENYLRGLAEKYGFEVSSLAILPVYPDYPMFVCVFRKA
jgi:predicted TPR repeat methyltransferase